VKVLPTALPTDTALRILFFKRAFAWPRSSGHDVHCYFMMQALAALGHEIGLVTLQESPAAALDGLSLSLRRILPDKPTKPEPTPAFALTRMQERFRSYFGVPMERIRALAEILDEFRPDAFVAGGLDILPYFVGTRATVSVWYAADELAWHHLSLLKLRDRSSWSEHGKESIVKAFYERAFSRAIDRAWVVSPVEARAMRWIAGIPQVDIVPNGVDATLYQPRQTQDIERSAVFWGRLDFGPNVQALEWFCRAIWPTVRRAHPDARFTIIGFQPIERVRQLAGRDGIELLPDLPDLREEVSRRAVVVLPFVSGGGIKNKLLEAASLGKAIVCTPRTCSGLRDAAVAPLRLASSAEDWNTALGDLWSNADRRRQLGADARAWVLAHHTWAATAQDALAGLRQSLHTRQRTRAAAAPIANASRMS
jgi:glycosyltransferase involved in cell wall biosynthesis